MILYFTDISDIMTLTDFYIHEPMADRENCGLIRGYNCGDYIEFWINESSFEYIREGLLSGKHKFLFNPTNKFHEGDPEKLVYEIVEDD